MTIILIIVAIVAAGFSTYYFRDTLGSAKYFKHQDDFVLNQKRAKVSAIIAVIAVITAFAIPVMFHNYNKNVVAKYNQHYIGKSTFLSPQEMDAHLEDAVTQYNNFGLPYKVYPFKDLVTNHNPRKTQFFITGIVQKVEKNPNSDDYFVTFQNSGTTYRINAAEYALYKLNREPSKITVEASTYENSGLYIHPVRTGLTTIAQSEDDIKSLNNTGDDEWVLKTN